MILPQHSDDNKYDNNKYDDNEYDDNRYDDNKHGLLASFWMASSSIGGLAARSWMTSLSSEFDDFAST